MKSKKNLISKLRQSYLIASVFVIALSLSLVLFVPKASAGTGFSLTTNTTKIQQNNTFNVGVKLTTTDPVLTISVCVDYPQDKLQFVGVDYAGSVFANSAPGNSKCTIYFERFTTTEVTGSSLHVATLTFKMLVSSGTADITFGKFTEAYTPPKLSLTNNNLTVSGVPIPPPTTSTNNSSSSTPPTSTSGGTKTPRSVAATNQNITKVETPTQETLASQTPSPEITDEETENVPIASVTQKKPTTSVMAIVGSIVGLVGITAVAVLVIRKNKSKDGAGPLGPNGMSSGQGTPTPPPLGGGMRELS